MKKIHDNDKHIFSLYIHNLPSIISKNSVTLSDTTVVHRATHVLRLQLNDTVILFDRMHHATVQITSITKNKIVGSVVSQKQNEQLNPQITFLLPVLKKDALSDALYNAVEVGANEIQLVYTDKAQRKLSLSELERLERMAIAAAEQSKQFAFPEIKKPIKLEEALALSDGKGIFFDPAGKPMREVLDILPSKKQEALMLLIGPEGDLTQREKEILIDKKWIFCALTPTVLRSVQAVAVSLGIFRSFLR